VAREAVHRLDAVGSRVRVGDGGQGDLVDSRRISVRASGGRVCKVRQSGLSWTVGSHTVNTQRQAGGQSQAWQSDGLDDVDRVGDIGLRQQQAVRGQRRVRGLTNRDRAHSSETFFTDTWARSA